MRLLITGGAGFLGSFLANRLVAQGHQVFALDNLLQGSPKRLSPAVKFIQGSVDDVSIMWSLLQGIECVYHLAARVSVPESVLYPSDYNTTNVGGTVSLMEAMRDAGVKRVVFASSGAIYGSHHRQPVKESDPVHPDSPYAVSKFSAEQYINTIGELWGLETVCLRIFNAYGPEQPLPSAHAPVVPRFLQQLLTGGSLVLYGDGSQTRDFVYVEDVVDALIAAGRAPKLNRQLINVGSGQETSILELVRAMEKVTGKTANLIFNAYKSGGVPQLVADIHKAKQLLDFRPNYTLLDGLERLVRADVRFRPYLRSPSH